MSHKKIWNRTQLFFLFLIAWNQMKAYSYYFLFDKPRNISLLIKHFKVLKFHSFCKVIHRAFRRKKGVIQIGISLSAYETRDKCVEINFFPFRNMWCQWQGRSEGWYSQNCFIKEVSLLAVYYSVWKMELKIWSTEYFQSRID